MPRTLSRVINRSLAASRIDNEMLWQAVQV